MAQLDGKRYLLSGGDEVNGRSTPPSMPRSYNYKDDHRHNHQERKSVVSKVKDKAKKWKQILQKKKQVQDADSSSNDASSVHRVSSNKDDKDEEDPEFLGAPMYESQMAPDVNRGADEKSFSPPKETTVQCSDASNDKVLLQSSKATTSVIADKHILEDKEKNTNTSSDPSANDHSNKTLTDTVSDTLAQAYAMDPEATVTIASKIQAPVLSAQEEVVAKQMSDKGGLTVKEYLLQKLEPGDDERVLSQVITEAISPKDNNESGGGVGVVEKVKDAVSSVFGGMQTTSNNVSPMPVSTMPHTSSVPANLTSQRPKQVILSKSMPHAVSQNQQQPLACSRSKSISASASCRSYNRSLSSNTTLPADSNKGEIEEAAGTRTLQEYLN